MAKLDFTKPITFVSEALGSSASQLVDTQIKLNNRKAEIVFEWEQLSAQQNLRDLKEQNRQRLEEDFERSGTEYSNENEEKFNELLREFQSSLDAGNDLIWIVREKERLALEYANIVLIDLKNKTFGRFEPQGSSSDRIADNKLINQKINSKFQNKVMKDLGLKKYSYISPNKISPELGIQAVGDSFCGMCVTISMMYLQMRCQSVLD